ncbi:MAG: hypothetical protein GXP42_04415, partial [Chloroflexi bacterium]|nr:hypothetical protein [Chloroflexota bacterium]
GNDLDVFSPDIFGGFFEKDGQLMFAGSFFGRSWSAPAIVLGQMSRHGRDNWYKVDVYIRNEIHYHIRLEDEIDWVGVGLDVAGIAADVVSAGVGGRVIQGVQVGRRAEQMGDALDVVSFGYAAGVAVSDGEFDNEDFTALIYAGLGFIPYAGTAADVVSLVDAFLDVSP